MSVPGHPVIGGSQPSRSLGRVLGVPAKAISESLTNPSSRGTTRRNVLAGAVWAVPVVATAVGAPAFAASSCPTQTLDWNQASGTHFASGSSWSVGGVTISLTYSGSVGNNNANVSTNTFGGVTPNLRFTLATGTNPTETIQFAFSAPVYNVHFTILDIDWSQTGSNVAYDDAVVINTAGYTQTHGANVQGTGSSATPFMAPDAMNGTPTANTSSAGNADLTWAGPVSSTSFTYSQNNSTVTGSPQIGISAITFTLC